MAAGQDSYGGTISSAYGLIAALTALEGVKAIAGLGAVLFEAVIAVVASAGGPPP